MSAAKGQTSMNGLLGDNGAMQTIRSRVAFHTRQHGFDRAAKQLVAGAGPAVTDRLVADLYAAWGDPLSQADERFLRSCLSEAGRAERAILQCGTNLATLLLGAVCDQANAHGKQLWCLEDNRHWAGVMRSWLTEYRIRKAHIIHTQARLFEDFVWYALDPKRLADRYSLIICDGAKARPTGVIGTLKRLEGHFDERFVVLVRNLNGASELRALAAWAKRRRASCVLVDKAQGFVKIASAAEQEEAPPLPETRTGASALRANR
jgi:hypothetical protein